MVEFEVKCYRCPYILHYADEGSEKNDEAFLAKACSRDDEPPLLHALRCDTVGYDTHECQC